MPRRKAARGDAAPIAPTAPIPIVQDVFADIDLVHLILDGRARIKSMLTHRAWMRSSLLTLSRVSQVNKFLHAHVINYFETILAHLKKRRGQFQTYVLNGRASEAPYNIPKRLRLNAHAVLLQLSDEHDDTVTEDLWEDGARTPCADTMPMLAARLAPRCLCCRLNTVPSLTIYGNCQSCVEADHQLSYLNCAELYHPYEAYVNDFLVYYYKVPYTSSEHFVLVIVTKTTDSNGNESLDAHVDLNNRLWWSSTDHDAKCVIRIMKAMGKLQPRLKRIYDKRHAIRLATVDSTVEMVDEHGFSMVLPLQRLLYDGIGKPDCSFAEVFGLSDAEIDVYAKLGKDVMQAERSDEILMAEENRIKMFKEYVFELERLGSGGAIWKRAEDGRLVIDANGDSAPSMNFQWFKTWKLSWYFVTPITTTAKAQRWTKLMNLFEFGGKKNMHMHFERIDQLAGMVMDNYKLRSVNESAVRAMASSVILCIPRMPIVPRSQWNGNIQSSAGKGIHTDLIFRHLLFNMVHTKRLIVTVSQVLVKNPRSVLCDRTLFLDSVNVRMSIASGGGLQSGTAHCVRLFGVVDLKRFLELLRSERETDDRILAFFNETENPAESWDLARLYTELNSVCEDVSKDISTSKTRVLRFFATVMLKGQVWMTEPFSSLCRHAPRVFFHNKKDFYDPDVRPFCEAQGFDKCFCQSRCTFSGRKSHQCVFGPSKKTLAQAELPF